MELPLILAGPILRRVDPSTVAVWMAFSEPADLELRVWEGRVAHDTTNPVFVSSDAPPDPSAPPPRPGAEAVRIGEHLYLGLVTARMPPASGKVFQPDLLYSYDVVINAGGEVLGLGERGLLATRTVNGVQVPPLGYDDRMLPSFALPPSELDHLRIAYGSCRRPGYDDGDALAWIDDLLVTSVGDPRARIHQLFLGGDQIYADDVDTVMMLRVVELGIELIGSDGDTGPPIERVKVAKVLRRPASTLPDPADPTASYTAETPDGDRRRRRSPGRWRPLPGRAAARPDAAQRPADQRRRLEPPDLVRRVRSPAPHGLEPGRVGRARPRRRGAAHRRHDPFPAALARRTGGARADVLARASTSRFASPSTSTPTRRPWPSGPRPRRRRMRRRGRRRPPGRGRTATECTATSCSDWARSNGSWPTCRPT